MNSATRMPVRPCQPDHNGRARQARELGTTMVTDILRGKGDFMRKSKSLFVFATAVLLASVSVHAQNNGSVRYRWHDAQGLLHFSDSLSSEAMKYGYDLVNDQGLIVQHVPRQLNAAERAAAKKLAEQQAEQQRIERDRANAEAQMLSAYPDEKSFVVSQQQSLDTVDQQIRTTRINLRSQEKALTDLLGRAADIERNKNPVPKFLADGIAKQRDVVTGQRNALQRQQRLRVETVQLQAQQLARYRELKAAQEQSPEE
jgi:hypothetical protein